MIDLIFLYINSDGTEEMCLEQPLADLIGIEDKNHALHWYVIDIKIEISKEEHIGK